MAATSCHVGSGVSRRGDGTVIMQSGVRIEAEKPGLPPSVNTQNRPYVIT